jgi:hypothetical protein
MDLVDWTRPWLESVRPVASFLSKEANWLDNVNALAADRGILNHRRLPIRFVPQSHLPANTAYEAFISSTGNVPTRDNLHDFFNALVWLSFPGIKVQLNALQASELFKHGAMANVAVSRGKLRDAATIFDENAALFVTNDATLIDALRNHQWKSLFIDRRADFNNACGAWLFGHALMEKLVSPYKAITAHTFPVLVDDTFFSLSQQAKLGWLDRVVSEKLAAGLTMSDLTPLPVLGVPGWWGGQDDVFYTDDNVFRPKRRD